MSCGSRSQSPAVNRIVRPLDERAARHPGPCRRRRTIRPARLQRPSARRGPRHRSTRRRRRRRADWRVRPASSARARASCESSIELEVSIRKSRPRPRLVEAGHEKLAVARLPSMRPPVGAVVPAQRSSRAGSADHMTDRGQVVDPGARSRGPTGATRVRPRQRRARSRRCAGPLRAARARPSSGRHQVSLPRPHRLPAAPRIAVRRGRPTRSPAYPRGLPLGLPDALAGRFAGPPRSRGSLAALARAPTSCL